MLSFALAPGTSLTPVANMDVSDYSHEEAQKKAKRMKTVQIKGSKIRSMYSIPKRAISESELANHKRSLTLCAHDTGFGQSPPPFQVYVETDQRLFVPRFYGMDQWGVPEEIEASAGEPMTIPFQGSLNEVQTMAVDDSLKKLNAHRIGGAMLVLPCGYGKTVCALNICSKIKRRTLVLVHKTFLVEQWHERARTFLPNATLGIIRQDTIDSDADIAVGMIQSVSKRAYPLELMSKFGFIIVDEAHHMSAPVFSLALRHCPAEKILALSATPERRDGLTCLLYWSMGSICHRIERKPEHTLVSCMIYEGGSRKEIVCRNGQISIASMLNTLAGDPARNNIIADRLKECHSKGRYIIVLSDRIKQLELLTELLIQHKNIDESDIGFYIGTTNQSNRAISAKRKIIMSTYMMAKEGLDIPRLDTICFATPKGDVVQASGRIQRKHAEKKTPLIIDIVDTFSIFEQLRWKRWKFYRNESFQCQTYNTQDKEADWYI